MIPNLSCLVLALSHDIAEASGGGQRGAVFPGIKPTIVLEAVFSQRLAMTTRGLLS